MNYKKSALFVCAGLMLLAGAVLLVQGAGPQADAAPPVQEAELQEAGFQEADLSVGKPAPDFTFTSAEGKAVNLSSLRGKPVVLHFWATWCGPCIRELPLIAALSAARAQELTVLAVNCGETEREVRDFLERSEISLNTALDRDFRISGLYRIDAIPQTYLIDEAGIIRSIRIGAYNRAELNRDISALLETATR